MDAMSQYLISNSSKMIQVPYAEYVVLRGKMEEAQRILKVRVDVLADLKRYQSDCALRAEAVDALPMPKPVVANPSVEEEVHGGRKAAAEALSVEPVEAISGRKADAAPKASVEIPPIKKEIEAHFNTSDDSGRLLNVFKQYYTFLNELCGGTVRVTMKDGICSLWNYDEWEEFAFIDIYENDLRFAVDPRYADALSALNLCEVSRLLASRRKLISVQVEDLNKTMLGVLSKAFEEVGLTLG
jgi:hypothetical protein